MMVMLILMSRNERCRLDRERGEGPSIDDLGETLSSEAMGKHHKGGWEFDMYPTQCNVTQRNAISY